VLLCVCVFVGFCNVWVYVYLCSVMCVCVFCNVWVCAYVCVCFVICGFVYVWVL